jgi:hypothetical protein
VKVYEAGIYYKGGGRLLLEGIEFPCLKKLWTDQGYAWLEGWVDEAFGWNLEVVSRPKTEIITGDNGQPKEVTIKVRSF